MYDLRILLIWAVLGFLLYLIAIRPEQSGNRESNRSNDRQDSFSTIILPELPEALVDKVIEKRLKEISFLSQFEPDKSGVPKTGNGILPRDLIVNRRVFPVKVESNAIVLAMIDPFDLRTIDEVRAITGLEIFPVKITARDFGIVVKCLDDNAGV